MADSKTKPVHRIHVGNIAAAIWANKSEKSGTWYSVTFSRSYKNQDTWKHTDSYSRDDLLVLAKVADLAWKWIHDQTKTQAAETSEAEADVPPNI